MFRGQFSHTIDSKNRVSIPSGFRVELQKSGGQAPILSDDQGCLVLYPYAEWCTYEDKILAASTTNSRVRKFTRLKLSSATETPIDSQGRILIPPFLRERAGLTRDVMIIGHGKNIELWDPERFEADINETQEHYDEIADVISGLGT
jgi:MraZ protein